MLVDCGGSEAMFAELSVGGAEEAVHRLESHGRPNEATFQEFVFVASVFEARGHSRNRGTDCVSRCGKAEYTTEQGKLLIPN